MKKTTIEIIENKFKKDFEDISYNIHERIIIYQGKNVR